MRSRKGEGETMSNTDPGLPFDPLPEQGIAEPGSPDSDDVGRSETRTWEELEELRQPIVKRLHSLAGPSDKNRTSARTWEELAQSRRSLAKRMESLPGNLVRSKLRDLQPETTEALDSRSEMLVFRKQSLLRKGVSLLTRLLPESGDHMRKRLRQERRARLLDRSMDTWRTPTKNAPSEVP